MDLRKITTWRKRGYGRIASYRDHAELRECDARMLRDIGLHRECGHLLPLHPEQDETIR
ncbi:DUF1127 domain-containing protein [Halomonas sp. LR3S48]|uniref:DUF1127 domain-containing protein n=1 Tax=Halomonas sp. LR3S48 TaxID=2982694 RepID=UPI0021E439F6|nr:DUF1127 domain-containing protein [Halomonas sp. LR3S48]UYG04605.1 DUF1127 domain-containing protein [Halomonas sp. LR3S48]